MTPGEGELARSELAAAGEEMRSAAALLDLGLYRVATSRLYYAAFHAARSALASRGASAKTHSGQVGRFTELFGPAPVLSRLLQLRSVADYGFGAFDPPVDDLRALVAEAGAFVERCRALVAGERASGPGEPDPAPDR